MARVAPWLLDLIKGIPATFIDTLRLCKAAWWIPLIAALPEFVQHVAEIFIGMFASLDAFKEHSLDMARMIPGGFKVAGIWIAIFVAARFWYRREYSAGKGDILWRRLTAALALNAGAALSPWPLRKIMTGPVYEAAYYGLSIITLPLMVYLFSALLGDRSMTLRAAFLRGWLRLVPMLLFAGAIVLVASPLHRLNHDWAIGHPPLRVWLLMTWDALLVGLMAAGLGVGVARGYAFRKQHQGQPK